MGGNAGVDGGAPAGSGGTGSGGQPPGGSNTINLDGSPIYTRMQRLTNGQWERAVDGRLALRFARESSAGLLDPCLGRRDGFRQQRKAAVRRPSGPARLRGRRREGRGGRDGVRRRAGAAVRGDRRGRVRADRGTTRVPPSADGRRRGEVPGRLRAGRDTLRCGLRKRGRPRHSRACCSRRNSCTAPSSGRRARRWTATSSPRSSRSGCSARRPATSCWTRPLRARSIPSMGSSARRARCSNGPRPSRSCATFTGSSTGWPSTTTSTDARRARVRRIRAGRDLLSVLRRRVHERRGLARDPDLDALLRRAGPGAKLRRRPARTIEERALDPSRIGYFMQVPFLLLNGRDGRARLDSAGRRAGRRCLVPGSGRTHRRPSRCFRRWPPGQTNRDRVEELTASCAGCHGDLIDPLGFAFEGFDGLGRRAISTRVPVEHDGELSIRGRHAPVRRRARADADPGGRHAGAHLLREDADGYALQRDIVEEDRPLLGTSLTVSRERSLKEMVISLVRNPAFRLRAEGTP